MHLACQNGSEECAELLINHGFNVNAQDKQGSTPLHWICSEGRPKLLRYFEKAKVNIRNRHGSTPLHWAVFHKQYECVKWLLTHGADPYVRDESNQQPVDYATTKKIRRRLEERMAQPSQGSPLPMSGSVLSPASNSPHITPSSLLHSSLLQRARSVVLSNSTQHISSPRDTAASFRSRSASLQATVTPDNTFQHPVTPSSPMTQRMELLSSSQRRHSTDSSPRRPRVSSEMQEQFRLC